MERAESEDQSTLARRWCEARGAPWHLSRRLGEGGTAPVFEVMSPGGLRALKIYGEKYSTGKLGATEQRRIDQQLALRGHDCPYLVEIHDGGRFEGRLFLLMSRAPGTELEKRLTDVPRAKIRTIVHQVASAVMFLRDRRLCHRDIKAANIFISDDFNHCTLLDVSVVRDVLDPIGVGTDQDNQLPVVATARYSPPEYLFRLLEPGIELWHALNVYQLGALLHDLIMRRPLFHAEHLQSSQNRYRFAWIVATMVPSIESEDVDKGLVLLAQRSLDKDWRRRSTVKIEDFLADVETQRRQAMRVIGLDAEPEAGVSTMEITSRIQKVEALARGLDEALSGYLKSKGVTAKHIVSPGSDDVSRILLLKWRIDREAESRSVELRLTLKFLSGLGTTYIQLLVSLETQADDHKASAQLELPPISDGPEASTVLAAQAEAAFEELAIQVTSSVVAKVKME